MTSRVAVAACPTYERDEVSRAVDRGMALLASAGVVFMKPGENLLLKPNMLVSAPPDACVTTHPEVFRAAAVNLRRAGADLCYGDSPGFGRPESVARDCGIADMAEEAGVVFGDFLRGRDVAFPNGELLKRWHFANAALDADGIVSLSKLKTHGLTRMTGAVKNLFGCIPGMRKGELHARMKDLPTFSRMLVEMNFALAPRLHIMDAVVAMEGNGPRGGDPRHVGALLFSDDPVALDSIACRLIGLDPLLVPTCDFGEQLGLGTHSDIEILGDQVEPLVVADFAVDRGRADNTGPAGGRVSTFMRRWMVPKPVILPERCTHCGTCVNVCPVEPKAVDWENGSAPFVAPPVYDYDECIRCYCCQEMCPEKAIEIAVPPLGRLIHK